MESRTYINLSGKRFRKLKIIKRVENDRNGNTQFLCKCDCGNEITALSGNIRHGRTLSCGCWNKEKSRKAFGISNFNRVLRMYKFNAKNRNIEWKLSKDIFKSLTQKSCHYCGSQPSSIQEEKDSNGKYIYNGIDRFDNKFGYIEGNCVTCCWKCNRMKGNMKNGDFISHIRNIYNHTDIEAIKEVFI